MLRNAYLDAKIGVDPAENERSEVIARLTVSEATENAERARVRAEIRPSAARVDNPMPPES